MTLLWREIRTVMTNVEALKMFMHNSLGVNPAVCKLYHMDSEFLTGLCVCALLIVTHPTCSCSAPLNAAPARTAADLPTSQLHPLSLLYPLESLFPLPVLYDILKHLTEQCNLVKTHIFTI